jgi:hypothetical protein
MATPVLTPDDVREYLRDSVGNNLLIDTEEFNDVVINLAMDLACSEFNMMPPSSAVDRFMFPNKALLMSGTLYKMFYGQAALLARNTMQYSDGGLQIPIEERFALYQSLAAMYKEDFQSSCRMLKISINMDEGWGEVRSDYATMPIW